MRKHRSIATLLGLGAALYLAGGAQAQAPAFQADLIGASVYDSAGEPVGRVKAVQADRLIVSVGVELGMGARDIVLTREQVIHSGAPNDRRLVTTLGAEELQALPEVGLDDRGGTTR